MAVGNPDAPPQFLLPCPECNHREVIDSTHAGLPMKCESCGHEFQAPTLLQIKKLERVAPPKIEKPTWGVKQKLIFVGGFICIAMLVLGVGVHFAVPPAPDAAWIRHDAERVPPEILWLHWKDLRRGIDYTPDKPNGLVLYQMAVIGEFKDNDLFRRRAFLLVLVGTIVGLVVLGTGFAYRPPKPAAKRVKRVKKVKKPQDD